MKIAVCFSGQIRTWKQCYESWERFFNMIKLHPKFQKNNIEVDYFIHTWDLETIPPHLWAGNQNLSVQEICDMRLDIDKNEIDELIKILNPKKYIVDNIHVLNTRSFVVNEKSIQYGNNGYCLLTWAAPQLYSIMRAATLKKEYELENDFEYDICMKFRFDMLLNTEDMVQIMSKLDIPLKDHTIYSMHSKNINEFPHQIIGDIWFMANSTTYDLLSYFYNFIPFIQKNIFKHNVTIEEVFAYYVDMFKIHNTRVLIDPKIIRRDYDKFLNNDNNSKW
jgi:hypothetical protein